MIYMDSLLLLLVFFAFILYPYRVKSLNLSEDEDMELEQLQLLNKPAIKTINSDYGDIFDCVDFYKQPAFDHPLLKNFTLEYAIARTKVSSRRYSGLQANMSIYNPQCVDAQYSAVRMKMSNGPDSIEVGWRVDPDLSGDSLTRFYIRTDAGQTHCYNLRCPGFVITAPHIPIDQVAGKISKLGGPIFEIFTSVSRASDGGWILQVGPYAEPIGFWPSMIFTSGGLAQLASSLSWGGEVYSPEGSPKPPMGSGGILKNDTNFSAYFADVVERDERGYVAMASDLEPFATSQHYQINDVGDTQSKFGHLVLYGGLGGSSD